MIFGRELCLPCDVLFGAFPNKKKSVTDNMADLVDLLHDIHHHFARQYLKVASDRMKDRYDPLENFARLQKGESLAVPCDPDQRKATYVPTKLAT
jgi:hypothetical protein